MDNCPHVLMNNISTGTPLNATPTGIMSFDKYPICTDLSQLDADIAIVGAPCDLSIQGRTGARFGPRGIRFGSIWNRPSDAGRYDPVKDEYYLARDKWRIVDCGDADLIPGDLEATFRNIEHAVREITRRGGMPVILGGDHSITIPVARGLDEVGTFHVLHFDSHLDWTDNVGGQLYSNGSPCRFMSRLPYVGKMAHLGINGIGSSGRSDFYDARDNGDVILTPKDIRSLGVDGVMEKLPKGERYFVTYDIDVFNFMQAPGTGSPMLGGMFYEEITELLEAVANLGSIVAFDLVEVSPLYDNPNQQTSILAATIIKDFLGYITKRRERLGER